MTTITNRRMPHGHTISALSLAVRWVKLEKSNKVSHNVTQIASQSLSQRSKTHTSLADPESASGATFQCIQFLPFLSIFSYLSYLGHTLLLGLQTKTRR